MSSEMLTETRKKLEIELRETVSNVKKLMQDLEALKAKQEQIKGGIFTLDMLIHDMKVRETKQGDTNGQSTETT
jgi:hypothetical protein